MRERLFTAVELEYVRGEVYANVWQSDRVARVSPETIIDIRPMATGERVPPNRDHDCLVVGATDMHQRHAELKAKGIKVVGATVRTVAVRGRASNTDTSPSGRSGAMACAASARVWPT